MLDVTAYTSLLVLDTQIALEGRPLDTLSWSEIDPTGPILLLLMPKMLSEVDSKKRDGRLGERARAFNRLIGPATESQAPVTLVSGAPRVDLYVCPVSRIDWDHLDDLDPAEGDDRIVAEALHAKVSARDRLRLLSYDMRPRANAVRHGVAAAKPPETWLLAPEPSPAEKRALALEQRVKTLEANGPVFEVSLAVPSGLPAKVYAVAPMDGEQTAELGRRIMIANPPRQGPPDRFPHLEHFTRDSSYDGRYAEFRRRAAEHGAFLHERLEALYRQVRLDVTVTNVGQMPADHMLVEVTGNGALVSDRLAWQSPFGPMAPKVRPPSDPFRNMPTMADLLERPDRDKVVVPETAPAPKLVITCEDFRHGRTWTRPLFITLDPARGAKASVEVRITAFNMRGEVRSTLDVAFVIERASVDELVDLSTNRWKEDWPAIQSLLKSYPDDFTRYVNDVDADP